MSSEQFVAENGGNLTINTLYKKYFIHLCHLNQWFLIYGTQEHLRIFDKNKKITLKTQHCYCLLTSLITDMAEI